MSVPYDVFTDAFLSKITEYDFVNMRDFESMTYPQPAMTSFESLM